MNCLERKVQKQRLRRIMRLNYIHGFFCKQLCTVLAPLCLYGLRKGEKSFREGYGKRPTGDLEAALGTGLVTQRSSGKKRCVTTQTTAV